MARLKFHDGFSRDVLGDWFWEFGSLECEGVRLLKLHGSVTWRRESGGERRLLKVHPHADRNAAGVLLEPDYEILTGTHNKILQYARGHFGDLHSLFRASLRKADCVVVAGFGFRDKAINTMLIEWMEERARRLVIVHPDPAELRANARPAVSSAWSRWEVAGKLACVEKRAEDASWRECRDKAVA